MDPRHQRPVTADARERELLHAQRQLTLEASIGLALRAGRLLSGLSQRAQAAASGRSAAQQARMETRAEAMSVGLVASALAEAGHTLNVVCSPPNHPPASAPEGGAATADRPPPPNHLPASAPEIGAATNTDRPPPPALCGHIGTVVASARRERGWSQRTLATVAGVGAGTVSRVEKGDAGVRLGLARAVLEALECELELVDVSFTPAQRRTAEGWTVHELLPRVRGGGRRYPGHLRTQEVRMFPRWWRYTVPVRGDDQWPRWESDPERRRQLRAARWDRGPG